MAINRVVHLSALAALTLSMGCTTGEISSEISMEVVHRSAQCGSLQPGLVWIKDRGQLAQAVTGDSRFSSQQVTPTVSEAAFRNRHFFLLAMGQKPTTGYRFRIEDKGPTLQGDTLVLPISYEQPGKDMQAQVITSPCMVGSLDKGAYQAIRVQDIRLSL